ncbi:MAG: cytochrome c biogenesis protein CcsA [Pontiellaceae bacterium]|nr:cytochrome c biogenesis protein CcsA [Pontiellaceae bacterium]MBN2785020.1 cytochrome c biogenesis protein CcsA [Pontiellaceae bacterium]
MLRTIIRLLTLFFAAFIFLIGIAPPKQAPDTFQTQAFARLPLKYEGRRKPVDTFARNLLTVLSGRQSIRTDDGRSLSAVEWLLDGISGKHEALDYKVFRIENLDVLSSLGLEERKRFRYSYMELAPRMEELDQLARTAFAKENRARDLYDRQIIRLSNKVFLFESTLASFEDPSVIPLEQRLATAQRYMQLERNSIPLAVAPHTGQERWRPLMSSLLSGPMTSADPLAMKYAAFLQAYRVGDVDGFNRSLMEYGSQLNEENPAAFHKIGFELFFNRLDAFVRAKWMYLLVFLLSCFGWLLRKDGLLDVAGILMAASFIPHTFGIVARCFLSGYPPITNLYSSAIFIGWAAVACGIILEIGFRDRTRGVGNLIGSIAGFLTLLIAQYLAGDGDTMEQMRAVLDTRFWLATHVITVAMGYVATFVVGGMGLFYILAGLFTRRLDAATEDDMYRMMYGTTCFALLFSFVGTVLGGLWADDSWGRFWGWDPKENGALLIVMWNAILLHARYGRMIRHRGFAVMAVFGNIVTAWSWFGVNQLSVGLHSYGFTDSAGFWLMVFVLSQLVVCGLGFIPSPYWKSGAGVE